MWKGGGGGEGEGLGGKAEGRARGGARRREGGVAGTFHTRYPASHTGCIGWIRSAY